MLTDCQSPTSATGLGSKYVRATSVLTPYWRPLRRWRSSLPSPCPTSSLGLPCRSGAEAASTARGFTRLRRRTDAGRTSRTSLGRHRGRSATTTRAACRPCTPTRERSVAASASGRDRGTRFANALPGAGARAVLTTTFTVPRRTRRPGGHRPQARSGVPPIRDASAVAYASTGPTRTRERAPSRRPSGAPETLDAHARTWANPCPSRRSRIEPPATSSHRQFPGTVYSCRRRPHASDRRATPPTTTRPSPRASFEHAVADKRRIEERPDDVGPRSMAASAIAFAASRRRPPSSPSSPHPPSSSPHPPSSASVTGRRISASAASSLSFASALADGDATRESPGRGTSSRPDRDAVLAIASDDVGLGRGRADVAEDERRGRPAVPSRRRGGVRGRVGSLATRVAGLGDERRVAQTCAPTAAAGRQDSHCRAVASRSAPDRSRPREPARNLWQPEQLRERPGDDRQFAPPSTVRR